MTPMAVQTGGGDTSQSTPARLPMDPSAGSALPSSKIGLRTNLADVMPVHGYSVTIPHKEGAAVLAEKPDEIVQQTKAANTLIRRESGGFYRCARCRAANVAEWRRRTKRRPVAEAGGRCKLRGDDRCLAALHFHHLDPAAKEFALSRRGSRVRSKDFAAKRRNACFYAPTVTPRWRRVSSNRRWR